MSIDYNWYVREEIFLHYGVSYTNREFLCVKIPKSASTWAKLYFCSLGWEDTNFVTNKTFDIPALVFIREPKERWIAGISEFLERYHHDLYEQAVLSTKFRDSIFDCIFDTDLSPDSHSMPQTHFIKGLTNKIYFKVDKNLSKKVAIFLGARIDREIVNSKANYPSWRILAQEYLAKNKMANKTLDSHLKSDYDLFKEVSFK